MTTSATGLVGGRYEIGRVLGQGAFGHTFLARDRQAERDVAVKVLDRRARDDWKAYELFKREAEVLAGLRHHGIPEVYDTLEDSWLGAPAAFLVMEYIEGQSLGKIIDDKRTLDTAEVAHLFLELLGILDYLHGRVPPILHRDIKPSNILVRPNGFPALVDFGSVRRVFLGPEESGSTVAGTFGYMPFEQYMGQASPASDLYALGGTFLHLLTGRPPRDFMSEDGHIVVPDTLPGEQHLRPVIARMLKHSPNERFTNARDVRATLVREPATLVPGSGSPRVGGVRRMGNAVERVSALPPAPRPLSGATKKLLKAASPGTVRMMWSSEKATDRMGIMDILGVGFFSLITAGILPMVFMGYASARRRRMRLFMREGTPGTAEVLKIDIEDLAFDEKMARVTYQFEADGQLHRDSDGIMPAIAHRWQAGDVVPILFLPDRDYDSVIVAIE